MDEKLKAFIANASSRMGEAPKGIFVCIFTEAGAHVLSHELTVGDLLNVRTIAEHCITSNFSDEAAQ